MSDGNAAQGHHAQAYGRRADMDDDAILDEARRIKQRRAARARRPHNSYTQLAQSSPSDGDIDPTQHPGSYRQPTFPTFSPEHADAAEHIRYPKPYSQPAQPIFSADYIRRANPHDQPAAPFPPRNADPIWSSNPYSQPAPSSFSQGSTDPYNPTAHHPFPHGSSDPYRHSNLYGQPTTHPTQYYQSNAGQFRPPNLYNAQNSRNPFATQATPRHDSDPTPQVSLCLPAHTILPVIVYVVTVVGTST